MTKAEEIKVELEALSELQYQLLQAIEKLEEPAEKARQAIKEESERLENVRTQCEENVKSCEENLSACKAALANCLACVEDEDTHCPSCDTEEAAVEQAEEDINQAQQELDDVIAHIANFQSLAEQSLNALNSNKETAASHIEAARQALYNRIMKTIEYLHIKDIALPPTPGQSSHGSEYESAKDRFFEEGAAGDFPNTPNHLRGWMIQEVNREEDRYRSVYGWRGLRDADGNFPPRRQNSAYHVSHTIRHLNIPENFFWELGRDNQRRAARYRRIGRNNF